MLIQFTLPKRANPPLVYFISVVSKNDIFMWNFTYRYLFSRSRGSLICFGDIVAKLSAFGVLRNNAFLHVRSMCTKIYERMNEFCIVDDCLSWKTLFILKFIRGENSMEFQKNHLDTIRRWQCCFFKILSW